MVNERVKIKKRNYTKIIVTLIVLLIILVLSVLSFVMYKYVLPNFQLGGSSEEGSNYPNPMNSLINSGKNKTELVLEGEQSFNESYINYVLFSMGAWNLHSTILSGNLPKIEVQVDETYSSEIIKGEIFTSLGEIEDEDIVIVTEKKEIIEAILSEDIGEYMKDSVRNKRTEIQMVAGYTELYGKGYLEMYGELTGESVFDSLG